MWWWVGGGGVWTYFSVQLKPKPSWTTWKKKMEKFQNFKANTKRYEKSAVLYMWRQLYSSPGYFHHCVNKLYFSFLYFVENHPGLNKRMKAVWLQPIVPVWCIVSHTPSLQVGGGLVIYQMVLLNMVQIHHMVLVLVEVIPIKKYFQIPCDCSLPTSWRKGLVTFIEWKTIWLIHTQTQWHIISKDLCPRIIPWR